MIRALMAVVFGLCATYVHAADPAKSVNGPPALATQGPKGEAAPPRDRAKIDQSIDRGVRFLIEHQNKNGSWGSARRTKGLNIYAPVPGSHHAFQMGTSALALAGLIEVAADRSDARPAIERGETWLMENLPKLRRAEMAAIYNTWGHCYGIQALVRMHNRVPNDAQRQAKIKDLIRAQIQMLDRYEFVNGGWAYYDFENHTQKPGGSPTSFSTATGLVALYEAKGLGIKIPTKLVDRAKASILRQRYPDFSYAYGEYLRFRPQLGINRPGGSLGRSQACNLAMKLWGDTQITDAVLTAWLDRLFARNGWLDIGRKRPIPHESWFQVAGYFFYYGHYYAALCIEQLPSDKRGPYQDHMAQVLLTLQEADGSWWDYPLYDYHQAYGTGFALMSLARCR
jgi:hypothetical protein